MREYLLIEGSKGTPFEEGNIWGFVPECQLKDSLEDILFEGAFEGATVKHDDKGVLITWAYGDWSRYIKLAY